MRTIRTKGLVAAMALYASVAVANPRQSIRLEVGKTVSLAGKTLSTGSYRLSWEGEADAVKVKVARGKTVIAETDGRFVDGGAKAAADAFVWTEPQAAPS